MRKEEDFEEKLSQLEIAPGSPEWRKAKLAFQAFGLSR